MLGSAGTVINNDRIKAEICVISNRHLLIRRSGRLLGESRDLRLVTHGLLRVRRRHGAPVSEPHDRGGGPLHGTGSVGYRLSPVLPLTISLLARQVVLLEG